MQCPFYGKSATIIQVDRDSNRTYKEQVTSGVSSRDEFYSYDSLNRLTKMDRGDLNGTFSGIGGTKAKEEAYTLDALGNWSSFLTKTSGTTDLDQSRSHNLANEIGTITTSTGTAWVSPVHDRAGNMTAMPRPATPGSKYGAVYDAWNRLVSLNDGDPMLPSPVEGYSYDGLGRRIRQTIADNADAIEHYFAGWRIVEHLTISGNARTQYVWGLRYIDELVCRDRDSDNNGSLDECPAPLKCPNS